MLIKYLHCDCMNCPHNQVCYYEYQYNPVKVITLYAHIRAAFWIF